MSERIVVLGASGLVGREIVRQAAALRGGGAVIAAVRRRNEAFPPEVEQRLFDAEDAASVPAICSDARHVINCIMGSHAAMIESCRGAIEAMAGWPNRRLVHFSSIAVFGDAEGTVAEDTPPGPPADGYAATKIETERMLTAAQDVSWTILRPGLIHGPGSVLWTTRIARLVAAGRLGPMGALSEAPCNLVAVSDVAATALAACDAPGAAGRAITLVAAEPPSWNTYLHDMARALGVPSRPLSPARLVAERALAYPLTVLERLRLPAPEAITPGLARLFGQQVRFESSAVPLLLPAWRDYDDALAEAVCSIRKG